MDEITLVVSSTINTVSLRTTNGQTLEYELTNGKTADMVSREIKYTREHRRQESPLPPVPSLRPDFTLRQPFDLALVSRDCGQVPPIGERPFWLSEVVPVNPEPGLYRPGVGLEPYISQKNQHIKSVCTRQPSKRFNEFITTVKLDPRFVDIPLSHQPSPSISELLYRKPRLSTLIKEKPKISTADFSTDNVESTLAECLRKIIRSNFEQSCGVEICPIGLTPEERQTFCYRLDLVENTLEVTAWKVFAQQVMRLNNDDLEMIDVFSCNYKCQVVEVVLDHWYKLHLMDSTKCLMPATKDAIIKVLNQMEKYDLLHVLHWPELN